MLKFDPGSTRKTMYSVTYSDANKTNELIGNYRSFEEAKEGGDRHAKLLNVGPLRWETNGIGAVATLEGMKYDIRSILF